MDEQLRFQAVNARLAKINGLPVSEHLGRTVQDVPGPALWAGRCWSGRWAAKKAGMFR